ncbi:cutinase family protein [Rhodococcoides fascians]|uniref:cutinase family protein n=2 Tax=Rhodococcoides fascians TaxID=1828 RepID=UPI00050C6BD4|nr:cutinase family protein [Rhodococcus fascians]
MAARSRLKLGMTRALATLSVMTVVAAGSAVTGLQTAAAQALGEGCTEYMAYMVPGTTETTIDADPSKPAGMLAKVGTKLEQKFGQKITVVYVNYSASAFDKGMTYEASESNGVQATAGLMAKCPTSKIVLAGYSQGAQVAGDVAWHIGQGQGPVPAASVRGVALLADPKRGSEKLVGVKLAGKGVAGERPGGYGSLEGRIKWVCDEDDMYCNTDSSNPFVGIMGKAVTGATDETVPPLDGTVGPSAGGFENLVSDFGDTDLTAVGDKASELKNRTEALTREGAGLPSKAQLDKIGQLAGSLNNTYSSTADIKNFADTSGTRELLGAEKTGTPGAQTSDVLSTLDGVDLGGLISNTASIAETVAGLTSGDTSTTNLAGGGEALKSLATMGLNVASQGEALSSMDRSNLTAATGVLGELKISTVVDTAMMTLTTVLSTDFAAIAAKVNQLGTQLAAMDAKGAHASAGDLNNMLAPWVDLAAAGNTNVMPMAASMVELIPDPSGGTKIAAEVMRILAKVDVKRLADNVGQAQEVAWSVVEGNAAEAVKLVPIGIDIGMVGLQSVLGGVMGTPVEKTGTSAVSAGGGDLVSMTSQLVNSVGGAGGIDTIGKFAGDMMDFGSFIASGVHTSAYTSKTLVGNLNSVDYMAEYFIVQLGGKSDTKTTTTPRTTAPATTTSGSSGR